MPFIRYVLNSSVVVVIHYYIHVLLGVNNDELTIGVLIRVNNEG